MGVGGCFVVLSSDCLYWTGERWSPKWEEALRFRGPLDPYAPCAALADRLRSLGVPCVPTYISRPEVAPRKV
jgi:hypothetical protein